MAIWYGKLTLAGLIWLAPFDAKSLCPQTRLPDFGFAGNTSTRLFVVSATKTLPFWSTFTSAGPHSEFGDACGYAPVLGVVVAKSDCPSTILAAPPGVVAVEKTRTRLSAGADTYKLPPPSMARPPGTVIVELDAGCAAPRVAKLLCPHTPLAMGFPPGGPNGAENFITREFLPSDTYRLPCASKTSAVGVSKPEPETGPPALTLLLKKSTCPITVSAAGGVGLFNTAALKRTTRWWPPSATHRLPDASKLTARGWFSEVLEGADAVRLLKFGCP